MFIQDCFIRCNSEELRQRLIAIGYSICRCAHFDGSEWLSNLTSNGSIHGIGYVDKEMFGDEWTTDKELDRFLSEKTKGVDCGTNEGLFLAVAALRDDTDKDQWFSGIYRWGTSRMQFITRRVFKCDTDNVTDNSLMMNDNEKLSVGELIEFFQPSDEPMYIKGYNKAVADVYDLMRHHKDEVYIGVVDDILKLKK